MDCAPPATELWKQAACRRHRDVRQLGVAANLLAGIEGAAAAKHSVWSQPWLLQLPYSAS